MMQRPLPLGITGSVRLSPRVRQWLGLIAVTGAAQVAVQAIGFIGGILVIRMLPVHEYALYTLANTMLGTMVILADGGIATGVMAEGGKVWQDKGRLGAVLATGMALRKKFAVFSLLVAVPILLYLLRKHDASWLMSTLIVLSLVPAFFSALSGRLLEIPPKLHQDIRPLQRYQVEANVGRLALLGLTMFAFPFAAVAIVCGGLGQVWNNWRLRKAKSKYVAIQSKSESAVEEKVLGYVRRQLPANVYYCVSGQLTLWLVSLLGTTTAVAQIGALGRLTAVISIVSTILASLVTPRFARLANDRSVLVTRYFQMQLVVASLGAGMTLLAVWHPQLILSLLGDGYEALNRELVLMVLASSAGLIAGTTFSLNGSRGIVLPPTYLIFVMLSANVIFLSLLRVDTVEAAALFSICINGVAYALHSIYGMTKLLVSATREEEAAS